jgi:hypothetical protein
MDRQKAAEALATLNEEADELRATIRESGRQLDAVRKLIKGYIELYPDLDPEAEEEDEEPGEEIPRGQEAVERLLGLRPGEWVTTRDVVAGMQRRGWLPESRDPAAAVRAALQRAWDDQESLVYKSGSGRGRDVLWCYDPPREDLEFDDDEDEDGAA